MKAFYMNETMNFLIGKNLENRCAKIACHAAAFGYYLVNHAVQKP